MIYSRGNSRPNLHLTFGHCPWLLLFFKNVFYQYSVNMLSGFYKSTFSSGVFFIKAEFSDKCAHLQDKLCCSWSLGCVVWAPLVWSGAKPHIFCNFVNLRPSQMQFEWSWGDNFAWKNWFKLVSFAYLSHSQLTCQPHNWNQD